MLELALVTNLESMEQVYFCGFLLLLEHVPLSSALWSLQYCLKSFSLIQPFLEAPTAVFSVALSGNQGQALWFWEARLIWGCPFFPHLPAVEHTGKQAAKPDKAGTGALEPSFTYPAL